MKDRRTVLTAISLGRWDNPMKLLALVFVFLAGVVPCQPSQSPLLCWRVLGNITTQLPPRALKRSVSSIRASHWSTLLTMRKRLGRSGERPS